MDLVKLITNKVKEVESSGKLEEIIEKHVLSCLDDVIRDSFNWRGEAKTSIEEALKGNLKIDPKGIKLARYQKLVSGIVEKRLNDTIVNDLRNEITEAVDKVTEYLEKKDWKLSEIISKYTDDLDKSYDGEMEEQFGECTLHVDNDGEFCHISFDKEENKAVYQCENRLFIHEGKLCSAEIKEKPFSPHSIRFMDSFEEFLFKLYCNNVSIIIDEDVCELSYYREDYH